MADAMHTRPSVITATTLVWLLAQTLTTAMACIVLLLPLLYSRLAGSVPWLPPWLPDHQIMPARAVLISVALVILLLRMALTSLVLLPRRIEAAEAVSVGVWLAVIHLGIAFAALGNDGPVGWMETSGALLFLTGSTINTLSELQRKRFKARPENRGKLFTRGLFSASMHINYFGDIVWAVGLAMMTGSLWAALIPLLMTAMFLWLHIPRLDSYLAQKYGEEFTRYRRTTRKLIPWIY